MHTFYRREQEDIRDYVTYMNNNMPPIIPFKVLFFYFSSRSLEDQLGLTGTHEFNLANKTIDESLHSSNARMNGKSKLDVRRNLPPGVNFKPYEILQANHHQFVSAPFASPVLSASHSVLCKQPSYEHCINNRSSYNILNSHFFNNKRELTEFPGGDMNNDF